eukprot:TRINITY_DN7927_c0_g2_i1.p1 TRINITY_DN7927_c0_g2~~TRINITY_DN7927_c0_g2_i1.p1  ORF type:complete len:472 (+),score=162.45 TRINITY_DN7927_c0_g2_i1:68-1417(+)
MSARLEVLSTHLSSRMEAAAWAAQTAGGSAEEEEVKALATLKALAQQHGLDVAGGRVRRTSSRFCLGVEHGDYNGTELFGVGTDRFIWLAYKPRSDSTVRIFSNNFPKDGVLQWQLGNVPGPRSPEVAHSWARFPFGCDHVLRGAGYRLTKGFDAVVLGNIPGGGMSRSASLSINLILTMMEVSGLSPQRRPLDSEGKSFEIVELAQKVENDYVGSPCGQLDQIMIYYAKAGMGTHYDPKTQSVKYVPLGCDPRSFSVGALDTGTDRPGLEKSTYKIRRTECDEFSALLHQRGYGIKTFGEVKDKALYDRIIADFSASHPGHCERLRYIYESNCRFDELLRAWREGDVATVGAIFRADGNGLRDDYRISGPELQTMCDIVRTVPGVLGERMLGGGDKGASGCVVASGSEPWVRAAVQTAYPRAYPHLAQKWAVHFVKVCDGVKILDGVM